MEQYTFANSFPGAIEGASFLQYNESIRLSEQALIDCSSSNSGWLGGSRVQAFKRVRDNHGIPTDKSYGNYRAQEGICELKGVVREAQNITWVQVPSGNIKAMKWALFNHGPVAVAVAVDADPASFYFYSKGVYFEPKW